MEGLVKFLCCRRRGKLPFLLLPAVRYHRFHVVPGAKPCVRIRHFQPRGRDVACSALWVLRYGDGSAYPAGGSQSRSGTTTIPEPGIILSATKQATVGGLN